MTVLQNHAHAGKDHDHSHGHAHGHSHDHGHAHAHPSATPAIRLNPPAWSLARASLSVRLAIAAGLVAAIWVAVLATIGSAP